MLAKSGGKGGGSEAHTPWEKGGRREGGGRKKGGRVGEEGGREEG